MYGTLNDIFLDYSTMDAQVVIFLILFLVSDNVIAFKNLMVYLLGSYVLHMIAYFYKGERPFWTQGKIDTY